MHDGFGMKTQVKNLDTNLNKKETLVAALGRLSPKQRQLMFGSNVAFSARDADLQHDLLKFAQLRLLQMMHQFMALRFCVSWPSFHKPYDVIVPGTIFSVEDFNRMACYLRVIMRCETHRGGGGRWYRDGNFKTMNWGKEKAATSPFYCNPEADVEVVNTETGRTVIVPGTESTTITRLLMMTEKYRQKVEGLETENGEGEILKFGDLVDAEELRKLSDDPQALELLQYSRMRVEEEMDRIERISLATNSNGILAGHELNLKGLPKDIRDLIRASTRAPLSFQEMKRVCAILGEDVKVFVQPENRPKQSEDPETQDTNAQADDPHLVPGTIAAPGIEKNDLLQLAGQLQRSALDVEVLTTTDKRVHSEANMIQYEPTAEELAQFNTLQKELCVTSSSTTDYPTAAERIGIDPKTRIITEGSPYELLPHQVVGKFFSKLPSFLPAGKNIPASRQQSPQLTFIDVAWMSAMEDTPLRGGVLAAQCGTGKTICSLHLTLVKAMAASKIAGHKHTCTMMVSPASVITQWAQAIHKFYPGIFRVVMFYGSPQTAPKDAPEVTLGTSAHDLDVFLARLDQDDHNVCILFSCLQATNSQKLQTSLTMILSTYGTIACRLLKTGKYSEEMMIKDLASYKEDLIKKDGTYQDDFFPAELLLPRGDDDDQYDIDLRGYEYRADRDDDAVVDTGNDNDDNEGAKCKKDVEYHLHLRSREKIGRMILDESHYIRNPLTKASQVIRLINALFLWPTTATPMISKTADLRGFLFLLFRKSWAIDWNIRELAGDLLELFNPANDLRKLRLSNGNILNVYDMMPPIVQEYYDETGYCLSLLDPALFLHLQQLGGQGGLESTEARLILPTIQKMMQLRRLMTDTIDLKDGNPPVQVGGSIPPYRVITMILEWDSYHESMYNKLIREDKSKLIMPTQPTSGPPIKPNSTSDMMVNARRERNISVVGLDLRFGVLLERARKRSTDVQGNPNEKKVSMAISNMVAKALAAEDHGLSQFFDKTKPEPTLPVYADRVTMARYSTTTAPKLAKLGEIVGHVAFTLKSKTLIMVGWPAAQV